jgi:hypothetical protein
MAAKASCNITMTNANEHKARVKGKASWSVVVVHEDLTARQRAVGFCDQLVGEYWERCEFEISWCPFDSLEEVTAARDAAAEAARADVILFSAASEGDFPGAVKAWIESWLAQRGEREGILIALMEPVGEASTQEGPRHRCLRNAAHHGAMDYLTHVPQNLDHLIPDSIESYAERADQVTSLLDNILHQQVPPPAPLP